MVTANLEKFLARGKKRSGNLTLAFDSVETVAREPDLLEEMSVSAEKQRGLCAAARAATRPSRPAQDGRSVTGWRGVSAERARHGGHPAPSAERRPPRAPDRCPVISR